MFTIATLKPAAISATFAPAKLTRERNVCAQPSESMNSCDHSGRLFFGVDTNHPIGIQSWSPPGL